MSGRARGRPRINNLDAPLQENAEEPHPPLQFATIEQFAALQEQMFAVVNMLQRVIAPPTAVENIIATVNTPVTDHPPAAENPPATEIHPTVEIPPSETMQTHEMTSTSRYLIPANWENILNEKVDESVVMIGKMIEWAICKSRKRSTA
ncbi:hypothetical protein Fot_11293 [Forsythia ovata]|uniref:Uncharacterized protein n=1 Tax=Forsythia ovata TaxID=205694 RepID=A0ABD1WJA5_9LAMI